jgi:hypothetical protein
MPASARQRESIVIANRSFARRALVTIALAWSWPGAALADDPPADAPSPDKRGYTLFNPTPPDLLRSFNTDRPTKANVPYTIDAGRYQVESDLGFFTRDAFSKSGVRQTTWTGLSPIFKAGLTNDLQADLVFSGLYNHTELTNRATGTTRTLEGFGDMTLRAKWNLWGNDGGATAFALMPYVKLPTNTGGVGNDQVEGGVFAPFAVSLPLDVTMIVMTQFDAQKDAGGNGTHAHFSQLVNLNRPIVENLTGYVELYADESASRGVGTFYTLDFGLAWVIAPDLQLDLGTYVGLNKAAPDLQAYFGIARRF